METLKSFLKEFAIMAPDDAQASTPQGDDMQFDISSQGDDDTVVAPQTGQEEPECVCKCDCPCCQKARAQANDNNIEVIDPKDDDTIDFDIEDDGQFDKDDEDQNDPMKD